MKYSYATDFNGPIAYPYGDEPPVGATPVTIDRLSEDCVCVVCAKISSVPCICRNCTARARRRMRNPVSVKRAPTGHWEPFAMSMWQDWHEQFAAYVDTSTDCHIWTHTKNTGGYGMFPVGGKLFLAHRLAFLLDGGEFGSPVVMHTCDNPACVNPKHLCGGTHKDNMQDMFEKGRRASPVATHLRDRHTHPRARAIITPDGKFASSSLAADFYGVTRAAISQRLRSDKFAGYKYA